MSWGCTENPVTVWKLAPAAPRGVLIPALLSQRIQSDSVLLWGAGSEVRFRVRGLVIYRHTNTQGNAHICFQPLTYTHGVPLMMIIRAFRGCLWRQAGDWGVIFTLKGPMIGSDCDNDHHYCYYSMNWLRDKENFKWMHHFFCLFLQLEPGLLEGKVGFEGYLILLSSASNDIMKLGQWEAVRHFVLSEMLSFVIENQGPDPFFLFCSIICSSYISVLSGDFQPISPPLCASFVVFLSPPPPPHPPDAHKNHFTLLCCPPPPFPSAHCFPPHPPPWSPYLSFSHSQTTTHRDPCSFFNIHLIRSDAGGTRFFWLCCRSSIRSSEVLCNWPH